MKEVPKTLHQTQLDYVDELKCQQKIWQKVWSDEIKKYIKKLPYDKEMINTAYAEMYDYMREIIACKGGDKEISKYKNKIIEYIDKYYFATYD